MLVLDDTKKLTVIVHSPLGVMGDVSGAVRVIESIHSQSPEMQINFVVFVELDDIEKIKKFVPRCVNLLRFIKLPQNHTHIKKGLDNAENILSNSDAIIFFATYRFLFSQNDFESLSRYHKPIMLLSDYDRHIKSLNIIQTQNIPICYENIGLGKNELGVFSPLMKDDNNALTKINTPSDMAFRDFLLQTDRRDSESQMALKEEQYFNQHDLYLGYFNLIKNKGQTSKSSLGHPVFFIEDCINRSMKNKRHNIDIVMPIIKEESDRTRGKNVRAVIQYFESIYADADLKFEFYQKTTTGSMKKVNEYGCGKTHIRIINGFPFAPETFQILLHVSEPFCLMTGNQSMVEAILHHKICLYQVMQWNRRFFDELVRVAVSILGVKSIWAIFLSLQTVKENENRITSHKKVTKLLLEYESEILAEAKTFKKYLETEKNLNLVLPNKILPILFDSKNYIANSLKTSQHVSFEYLTNMAKIFPNSKAYILNYLFQTDYFQPFLVFEYLDGEQKKQAEAHSLMPNEQGQYEIKAFTETFGAMLKTNRKVDMLLAKNLLQVSEHARHDGNISDLLANFLFYMVQHEARYCEFYPKFCRTISQMHLSESIKQSNVQ